MSAGSGAAFGRGRNGYVLRIAPQERALVVRLLDELGELLTAPAGQPATARLFPVVHPDDPEREAEYQRLMRDELVTSRLAGIETVKEVLGGTGQEGHLDRGAADVVHAGRQRRSSRARHDPRRLRGRRRRSTIEDHVPEYQLYAYLSWLLDSAVLAASGR